MTDYVSDAQARSLILDVGRRLYHSGFVASNDGNITCKVGDNAIWATPTSGCHPPTWLPCTPARKSRSTLR